MSCDVGRLYRIYWQENAGELSRKGQHTLLAASKQAARLMFIYQCALFGLDMEITDVSEVN